MEARVEALAKGMDSIRVSLIDMLITKKKNHETLMAMITEKLGQKLQGDKESLTPEAPVLLDLDKPHEEGLEEFLQLTHKVEQMKTMAAPMMGRSGGDVIDSAVSSRLSSKPSNPKLHLAAARETQTARCSVMETQTARCSVMAPPPPKPPDISSPTTTDPLQSQSTVEGPFATTIGSLLIASPLPKPPELPNRGTNTVTAATQREVSRREYVAVLPSPQGRRVGARRGFCLVGQIAIIMGPAQRLRVILGKGRIILKTAASGRPGQAHFETKNEVGEGAQRGDVGRRAWPSTSTTLKWKVAGTRDDGPPLPPQKQTVGPLTSGVVTVEELEAKVVPLEVSVKASLAEVRQPLFFEISKSEREDSVRGVHTRGDGGATPGSGSFMEMLELNIHWLVRTISSQTRVRVRNAVRQIGAGAFREDVGYEGWLSRARSRSFSSGSSSQHASSFAPLAVGSHKDDEVRNGGCFRLDDGPKLPNRGKCANIGIYFGDMEIRIDAYVLHLSGVEVIPRVAWICILKTMVTDWEAIGKILARGHSRVPIDNGSPKNIIGLLRVRNLLTVSAEKEIPVSAVSIRRMLSLVWLCTNASPTLRPSLLSVVSMLEGKTPIQAQIIRRGGQDAIARFKAFELLSQDSQTLVSFTFSQESREQRNRSADGPWVDFKLWDPGGSCFQLLQVQARQLQMQLKDSMVEEATREDAACLESQFPYLSLEDKAVFQEGGIDRPLDDGTVQVNRPKVWRVYVRKNRRAERNDEVVERERGNE